MADILHNNGAVALLLTDHEYQATVSALVVARAVANSQYSQATTDMKGSQAAGKRDAEAEKAALVSYQAWKASDDLLFELGEVDS